MKVNKSYRMIEDNLFNRFLLSNKQGYKQNIYINNATFNNGINNIDNSITTM